jgi:hypothetical protein
MINCEKFVEFFKVNKTFSGLLQSKKSLFDEILSKSVINRYKWRKLEDSSNYLDFN